MQYLSRNSGYPRFPRQDAMVATDLCNSNCSMSLLLMHMSAINKENQIQSEVSWVDTLGIAKFEYSDRKKAHSYLEPGSS